MRRFDILRVLAVSGAFVLTLLPNQGRAASPFGPQMGEWLVPLADVPGDIGKTCRNNLGVD